MTAPPICFLRGTKVLTSKGEVFVEDFKIGDLVETMRGYPVPIKWIGRQSFKKESERWHKSVLPVRICRSALEDGVPHTDLYVSPNHRLYLDSVLIAAHLLVNGRSIVQAMPDDRDQIDYFHVELEQHDVIFAEGAAAETFQLMNGREHFSNFIEYERLYGVDPRVAMLPYAPNAGYNGRRSEFKRILCRALSTIVDVRDPVQLAYDRIAARELAD
jgi:Hint domain-containing protein